MLSKLARQIRQQWIGSLALFLVLAGGTAYATGTIGSADVIDNSLQSIDLKNNAAVKSADVRNDTSSAGGLAQEDLADGSVGGGEVIDGSLSSAETDPLVASGNKFSAVAIEISAAAGDASFQKPWGPSELRIKDDCGQNNPPLLEIANLSGSDATLNWFYGTGSDAHADGAVLDSFFPNRIFDFHNGRLEGQFIYADQTGKYLLELHAIDLGDQCEVHGIAIRAAG